MTHLSLCLPSAIGVDERQSACGRSHMVELEPLLHSSEIAQKLWKRETT